MWHCSRRADSSVAILRGRQSIGSCYPNRSTPRIGIYLVSDNTRCGPVLRRRATAHGVCRTYLVSVPCPCPASIAPTFGGGPKHTTRRGRRCTACGDRLGQPPCMLSGAVCALAGKSIIPLFSVSSRAYPPPCYCHPPAHPSPVLCGGDGLTRPPARLGLPEPLLTITAV